MALLVETRSCLISTKTVLDLQVFRLALDSGEYVQIRNALIVLNKIVKVRRWFDKRSLREVASCQAPCQRCCCSGVVVRSGESPARWPHPAAVLALDDMRSTGAQVPPASCSCRVCVRSGASRQSSFTLKPKPKHKYEYKCRAGCLGRCTPK